MSIKGNLERRILLFTPLVLIIPLLIFPRMFGTQLAKASVLNLLNETVFYGLMVYLFNRRISLKRLLPLAGLCLVYRLFLGTAFGFLVAVLYSMKTSISLMLGIFSYLPSVIFMTLATPFVLKPLLEWLSGRTVEKPTRIKYQQTKNELSAETIQEPRREEPPITGEIPVYRQEKKTAAPAVPSQFESSHKPERKPVSDDSSARSLLQPDINGFERAVRYIGEHGSVHLAAVVDYEGLMLANFRRGNVDAELWAPLALMFFDINRRVLDRTMSGTPEKIDLALEDIRIVIARINSIYLMVVAERQSDDFLNIRINQGMEIIKKYWEDRYANHFDNKLENINVSGIK
ncbi:MAG: hypothetical protein ACOYVF_07945 [Candidatus Zixiibacteriota bacterium]